MNKKVLYLLFLFTAFLLLCIPQTHSKFTTTSNSMLSLEFSLEPAYTYYFQLPPDWGSENVYAYMWGTYNGAEVKNTSWGSSDGKATCVDSTKKIYSYTLPTSLAYETYGSNVFNNLLFYDGTNYKKSINFSINDTINGKIFVPEIYTGSGTRVFSYDFDPCYIYMWNSSGYKKKWPGEQLPSSNNISDAGYYVILDGTYPNFIFNKNQSGKQTDDLTIPSYQDLTYSKSYGAKWSRIYYHGTWHNYSTWTSSNSSEYNTWYNGDYQTFVTTKNAGY